MAATSIKPRLPSGAKTMRPSDVHAPPAESVGASTTRVGPSPPETGMRQIAPREKYATAEPSGEKKGALPPVVSGSSRSFAAFTRDRTDEDTPPAIRRAFGRVREPLAVGGDRERAEDAVFRNGDREPNGGWRWRRRCTGASRSRSTAVQQLISLAARTHVAEMDCRGGGRALRSCRVVARSTYGFSNCNRDAAHRRDFPDARVRAGSQHQFGPIRAVAEHPARKRPSRCAAPRRFALSSRIARP